MDTRVWLHSFSARLILLTSLSAFGLVLQAFVGGRVIESIMLDDRIQATRSQVETARSLVAGFAASAKQGEEAVAKEMAKQALRSLRYGEEEYFFVYDSVGNNIAHGSKPEREGKNFLDAQDVSGKVYYPEMIAKAMSGGGHVFYMFPRMGSTEPVRKMSYAVYFEPWDWVIGTGIYVDDVDASYWGAMRQFAMISGAMLVMFTLADLLLVRAITRPVLKLAEITRRISSGDFSIDIPWTRRRDEIGTLSKALLDLRSSSQGLETVARLSAHDLQEPLRLISCYLQLLKRRYATSLDNDANEFIDFTVSAALRLRATILGVTAYIGLNGADEPEVEVDLDEMLSNVAIEIETRHRDIGVVITRTALPTLHSRKALLWNIFANLVENGIKFHRQGVTPTVRIAAVQKSGGWEFTIEDNGIGIEQQYFEYIFSPFKRLHSPGSYDGAGIGLSLVKKSLDMLGGRIWIQSNPGNGSTFHVFLPVSPSVRYQDLHRA